MENKGKFYLTTAIAYASRKPHIGNTYEIILADAIARYKRMCGFDVRFMTGTDEHGQKIEGLAKEAGISPKEYADSVSEEIRRIWDRVGASYDRFIRTTDEDHEKAVAKIFKKLYDQGDIYKSEYEGWYCTPCESFFTETQVGEEHKCPDCGAECKKTKEEAYFLAMSKYADRLMEYIDSHPEFIVPESRKKEMVNNFLKPGLQDLCVSRTSFKWGIPVSFDPDHVIYVWIDALCNYITGLGYDIDGSGELYSKYWPADVHIIGKDILRFHTIYWPIILMALGQPLPKCVFGHPWLLFGADKMSKSKGNVIYADDLIDMIGRDGCRYYCLSEMPYANDGSITYESVINRYNTDLANNLGNLTKRSVAMTAKYFDSVVPQPREQNDLDIDLKKNVSRAAMTYFKCMDEFKTAEACEAVFTLLRRANKYIDETTPWVLAKNEADKERLGTVLYNLLEVIRIGATLLTPIMPDACERIFASLGTDKRAFADLEFGALEPGGKVCDSEAIFARLDEKTAIEQFEANAKKNESKPAPEKLDEITIDDFMGVELRSAKVLSCEKLKKSKKLLKLILDLGYEKRQVLSGIAPYYAPEELVGKTVALVCNLKPAKLCGEESQGMILACGEESPKVVFLDPETPVGERIR